MDQPLADIPTAPETAEPVLELLPALDVVDTEEEEALGEEDLSIIHHRHGPAGQPPRTSGPG